MSRYTQGPWHYLAGAVWASPEDFEKPHGVCIAKRGTLGPGTGHLPEPIDPCTKDANLRLCSFAPELVDELKRSHELARQYAELTGDEGAQADVARAAALLDRIEREC